MVTIDVCNGIFKRRDHVGVGDRIARLGAIERQNTNAVLVFNKQG